MKSGGGAVRGGGEIAGEMCLRDRLKPRAEAGAGPRLRG